MPVRPTEVRKEKEFGVSKEISSKQTYKFSSGDTFAPLLIGTIFLGWILAQTPMTTTNPIQTPTLTYRSPIPAAFFCWRGVGAF